MGAGFPYAGTLDNGVNFTNGLVSSVAGMDNDTTEFQMTAAVQPGNSGGPVLDGSGALLGVTVARINDVGALMATNSVPQTIQLRHQGRRRGEGPTGERGRAEDRRSDRGADNAADRGGAFTAQISGCSNAYGAWG